MSKVDESYFDVMNCNPIWDLGELDKGRDWAMEPKLNGFRLTAYITPEGVEFRTRSKRRRDGFLPHIERELMATFPPGTVLDGELVAIRFEEGRVVENFEFVQSVMLSATAERAVRVQTDAGRWLKFIVFDCLRMGPEDIRDQWYMNRVSLLAAIALHEPKHIAAQERWDATPEIHEALVKNGFEGTVVKDFMSPYINGQRGGTWFKWKDQPHLDMLIVGYKPGKGKFLDKVGAVHFAQPLDSAPQEVHDHIERQRIKGKPIPVHEFHGRLWVERGHCSGMDDAERQEMTDHMDELLGTVVEVAHMGLFPGGVTMRHPNFKRFRPDKPHTELVWHDR